MSQTFPDILKMLSFVYGIYSIVMWPYFDLKHYKYKLWRGIKNICCLCSSRGLDSLNGKNKSPGHVSLPLEGVILSLQDLIFYFRPPEEELEHEEKQTKLRSLRNRQNLFQEEVIWIQPAQPHTPSEFPNLLIFTVPITKINGLCKVNLHFRHHWGPLFLYYNITHIQNMHFYLLLSLVRTLC